MQRFFFIIGSLLAGLSVAIGAATGHETSSLGELAHVWVAKATRYQFYHSLALIAVAISLDVWQGQRKVLAVAGCCFIGGIFCFSGSLYFMAFSGISAGYITPLGGVFFLTGWLAMVVAGSKLAPPSTTLTN
ncbi:DUF423 domain-containing protein [Desulfopila sp. IMCC35008]|uniref:DUF423 domain-containing protein n=1 Tax=Desulfopila sp. IMCC35008 TaxID=2653858 RepID=UPI0013D40A9D|nr:DUF423 domain-containing protein [Desulfopila sp. IMCC35008]